MYCNQCGAIIGQQDQSCRTCGKRQNSSIPSPTTASPSPGVPTEVKKAVVWRKTALLGTAVAVLVAVGIRVYQVRWVSKPQAAQLEEPKQAAASTSAPPQQSPVEGSPSDALPRCASSPSVDAREKAADIVQGIYKREGRLISVRVSGDACDVLELSSGLMIEGNYTTDAAKRETIYCEHCMLFYEKVGFKQVRLTGPNGSQVYALPIGNDDSMGPNPD